MPCKVKESLWEHEIQPYSKLFQLCDVLSILKMYLYYFLALTFHVLWDSSSPCSHVMRDDDDDLFYSACTLEKLEHIYSLIVLHSKTCPYLLAVTFVLPLVAAAAPFLRTLERWLQGINWTQQQLREPAKGWEGWGCWANHSRGILHG